MPKKITKVIKLLTDSGFEGSAIELLQSYEPGPVFCIGTDTPDGPGVFLCDQPFTVEEAEAQHNFYEESLLENEVEDDVSLPDVPDDF